MTQDTDTGHDTLMLLRSGWPRSYVRYLGRKLMNFLGALHGLGAFALITTGILFSRVRTASNVIRPLVLLHLARVGLGLLPMVMFVAGALGLVVIGQTVSLLSRVGAQDLLGTVMAAVVVRELGPMLAALLVLARVGTANVIELGTARAMGEVESLEALGIDPIHFLVVPRVLGMAVGSFALTVYLILGAVISGYLWAFLQDVPILPGDYFRQLAESLQGLDFVVLAGKTILFGAIIAVVTCFHGLAQPLRLEEISRSTIRAVGQSVVLCVMVDALFLVLYLTV